MSSRESLIEAHDDIISSEPLMNTEKPILKEGWLKKESKYLGKNRKRWIVFQYGNHIYSYKKKQHYKYHTEDIDITNISQVNNDNNNDNQFILIYNNNNNKMYKFTANSKHDKNEWISTIKNWIIFNNEIKEYKRKWRKLIGDRTIKKMENECSNNLCLSYYSCQCTKRVVFVLNFYRVWCQKNFIQNKWIGISIESILKYEFVYNSIQLINDFNHILNYHYIKNKTHFFNYFINELGICGKHKFQCIMYLRNNRNRFKLQTNDILRNKIYFGYSKCSQIISMQILDSFHSFILHQNEENEGNDDDKKYDDDNDIISLLKQHQDTMRYNKYITIINNDDNRNKFGDNFSYWLCDKSRSNYISPKFNSLKQEILYNNLYCLTQFEWNIIREKAMKYKYSIYGKKIISNNISSWNKRTQIKSGINISIKHIIVLLLNTNYSQLSILFKKQCQKQHKNETQFNLKKRNQIIANFCKLLFESVYLFGNVMYYKQNYYHNLNCKPLFNSFKLNFKSPISVSTNIHCIQQYNNNNGCILQLKPLNDATMPYFDINVLSDYIHENEKLLFRVHLNINNIILIINNKNKNDFSMNSLKLFIAMTDGSFFTQSKELINIQTQNGLIKMLNTLNNNNNNDDDNKEEKNDHNDNNYIHNLFNHYVESIKNNDIWINENELEKLDKTLFKIFMTKYLENRKNINKIQLFSWHIDLNKIININIDDNNDEINDNDENGTGPTLLYTYNFNDSLYQIAFDSFCRIKSEINKNNNKYCIFYFRLSSFPINFKRIDASFYLYCKSQDFYAQIIGNKMSIYSLEGLKQVAHKININEINNNNNNDTLIIKIAIKINSAEFL